MHIIQNEVGARFSSPAGAIVTISKSAISEMVSAARLKGDWETGGILIGRYSDDLSCALIESATRAPWDSNAGPNWFVRGKFGLRRLLNKNWGGGRYYVGEWHSHPNFDPSPSADDIRAIQRIARDWSYACERPILAIVGGSFTYNPLISVTLGARTGEAQRLRGGASG